MVRFLSLRVSVALLLSTLRTTMSDGHDSGDAWSDHGARLESGRSPTAHPDDAIVVDSSSNSGYSEASITADTGTGGDQLVAAADRDTGTGGGYSDVSEDEHHDFRASTGHFEGAAVTSALPAAVDRPGRKRGRGRPPGATGSRDYKRLCRELSAGPLAKPFVAQPWTRERQLILAREALAEKRSATGGAVVANDSGATDGEQRLVKFFKRGATVSTGIRARALKLLGSVLNETSKQDEQDVQNDYVKSMKYMFETRCGERQPIPSSWAAEAQIVQVPSKSLQDRFLEIGALVEIGSRGSWTSIFRHVMLEVRQHRALFRLFLRGFRSDSTPIQLRVEDGSASDVWKTVKDLMGDAAFEEFKANVLASTGSQKTKQIAKVIQSEYRITMMLEDAAHGDLHVFGGHVATHLQYSDFGSAECLWEAEKQQLAIEGGDAEFYRAAQERGSVDAKDMAYSNARQNNYDRSEDRQGPDKWERVSNNCRVHRLQTVFAKVLDIVAHHISGTVNISLAMRAAGMLEKFLEVLGDVLVSRLDWARGGAPPAPGSEQKEYRDLLADYLFSPVAESDGLTDKERKLLSASRLRENRAVFDKWMLSDPREDRIVVYYNGSMTKSMVTLIYRFKVARAFMPSLLPLFARHRWTGSKSTLQRILIVFIWNNLGAEVIPLWIQRTVAATVAKELALKTRRGDKEHTMQLELQGYCSDLEERSNETKAVASRASAADQTAGVVALISGSYDWSEHNKTLKCDAAKWAASEPSGVLMTMNIVVDPFVRLMHNYLSVAAEKWLQDEAAKAAREDRPPRLRVSVAYEGKEETKCATELLDLLLGSSPLWQLLPAHCRTLSNRSISFCMLSRGGCGTFAYLFQHGRDYPQKYLHAAVTGDEELMQEVVQERCRHDDHVARKVKEANRSVLALLDGLNRAKAICYASMWELDIAAIECRNGHAQRYARVRSTHVTPVDAIFASTFFLVDRERQRSRHHFILPAVAGDRNGGARALEDGEPPERQKARHKKKDVAEQSARRWAWYTFVSEECQAGARKNMSKGEVFKGMGERFQEIKQKPGQYLQLLDRAENYRDTAASGNVRPFQRGIPLLPSVAEGLKALADATDSVGGVDAAGPSALHGSASGPSAADSLASVVPAVPFEDDLTAQLRAIRSANRRAKKEQRALEQEHLEQLQKWSGAFNC